MLKSACTSNQELILTCWGHLHQQSGRMLWLEVGWNAWMSSGVFEGLMFRLLIWFELCLSVDHQPSTATVGSDMEAHFHDLRLLGGNPILMGWPWHKPAVSAIPFCGSPGARSGGSPICTPRSPGNWESSCLRAQLICVWTTWTVDRGLLGIVLSTWRWSTIGKDGWASVMGVSKHVKVSIHETANQQKCSSQVGASLGGMEFSHNLWKSVAKIESSQRHAECLCSFYVPRSSWELRKSLASALHFLLFWLSPMKNESISGLLQPKSCSLLPDPLVSYLRKLRLFLFFSFSWWVRKNYKDWKQRGFPIWRGNSFLKMAKSHQLRLANLCRFQRAWTLHTLESYKTEQVLKAKINFDWFRCKELSW